MGVRTVLIGVLVLGVAAGAGIVFRHFTDARIDREIARLTALFDRESEEELAVRYHRPPAPGEPTEGDAADWYRKAFDAFERCGIERARLYGLGRPDEGLGDLLREVEPILELVEKGVRARFATGVTQKDSAVCSRIGELLLLSADRRPDRRLTAFRYGGDLFIGAPYVAPLGLTREAAVEALVLWVATQRAGSEELAPLIDLLLAELSLRPEPWDAYRTEIAGTEWMLRCGLNKPDELAPVAAELGLEPTRRALVDAWIELRAFSDRRIPADPPSFLHVGEVTFWSYERSRLELSALLLGALMLREKHRTGSFPTDLVALRPPEVTGSPAGGRWSLEIDAKTGLPAIFIRGGAALRVVTEAEKGLPVPPAFEFRRP
jgi:hypothetical protein